MTTTYLITLVPHTCGGCGVVFGMEQQHLQRLKDENGSFYCPNGCSRQFCGETKAQRAERLQRQAEQKLQRERQWRDQREARLRDEAEAARRSAAAHKGAHTRTKNRVAKGVCPCCNRTFQNLQRHMQTQHPEYQQDSAE